MRLPCPETIHLWGCFSFKRVGSLTISPNQNILRQQFLPTIQGQFGEEQCLFQHDGARCHEAKVITKWCWEQNTEILGPLPGNSPDLNPIENLWSILKRRVDKRTPSIDYERMGCHRRPWPRSWLTARQDKLQRSWKRKANTTNIDSLHKRDVIVNKSLWNLWSACNYTSIRHRITEAANFAKTNICVIDKTFWPRLYTSFFVTDDGRLDRNIVILENNGKWDRVRRL